MSTDRLDEKLADKLKISGNIKLIATSISEFDELMVKIETLKNNCPTMDMDVSAQWEIPASGPWSEGKVITKFTTKNVT